MKLRTKLWYLSCGGYTNIAVVYAFAGSGLCVAFSAIAAICWMMAEKRLTEDLADKKEGE